MKLSPVTFLSLLGCSSVASAAYSIVVDSFEVGHPGSAALDGNTSTFWHTDYSTVPNPGFPHNATIDMAAQFTVNGFVYTPRQDGTPNGNIGRHEIEVSTDGTKWTTVAYGTFIDDSSVKTVNFTQIAARYIRIIALTEAGNRGNWSSAAEFGITTTTAATSSPATLGQWNQTITFPLVPVAIAMLPSGAVLAWSSYEAKAYGGTGLTVTATYYPSNASVTEAIITNTEHDMFCPGLSLDFNGRVFVTGGDDAAKTSIHEPGPNDWIAGAEMNIPRGYQASATLTDGRTFVIGGSWSGGYGGKNGEIYDPTANTWTKLSGCPVAPMLTDDAQGIFRQDNHGWLFAWKDGYVFQAGPSKAMNWYGTTGSGSQAAAGLRGTDTDAMDANAVMYDAVNGKILAVGGSPSYQDSDATSNAHIITIPAINATASVVALTNMHNARAFANGVVLPDGKVFITGGQTYALPFSDATSIFTPEMWDPETGDFTEMSPISMPRNYHSTAVLMMDGTVFNGGGGLCGSCSTNHLDAQIYRPPYLYNADGSDATRPIITSVAESTIAVGGTIEATVNSAVTSWALIRAGSATHTVDTDQRRIALNATASGLTYSMTIPSDAGIALPGYWMLWALNEAGTPSLAQSIQVTL